MTTSQKPFVLTDACFLSRKNENGLSFLAGQKGDNKANYLEVYNGKHAIPMPGDLANNLVLRKVPDVEFPNKTMPKACYAGTLRGHFGHFLIESLGRLWATQELHPDTPIVFSPRDPTDKNFRRYHGELIRAMGIPNPLVLLCANTGFEQLIVPQDEYNFLNGYEVPTHYQNWITSCFGSKKRRDGPDLYVSRSNLNVKAGRFLGEKTLEKLLEKQGYKVFHPQEHSVAAQIQAFQNANRLIFAESSALHLFSLVGRLDQKVAMISRRSPKPDNMRHGLRVFDNVNIEFVEAIDVQFVQTFFESPQFRGVTVLNSRKLGKKLFRRSFIDTAILPDINSESEAELARILRKRGEFSMR